MTATTTPPAADAGSRFLWALRDGWTVARREFAQMRHAPGELIGAIVFPAVLVLLFGYVFGSAIAVPGGGDYREYLIPGLFAMTAIMGVMLNALVVSKDVTEGVMDRFRSIPMARSAVPLGRCISDIFLSGIGIVEMTIIGLIVGWSPHEGLAKAAAAYGLIVLVRFAISWIGVFAGLSASPETVDGFVPLVFPVTMLSNVFVPTSGMADWLQTIADWNPVSALVQACRELFGNPSVLPPDPAFPLAHPIVATIGWSVLILAIFVPLSARRFRALGR